jgi:hypothetical protein
MKLATPYLTEGYAPETAAQIRKTHIGMASWAGSRPFGVRCGECRHYGAWKPRDAAGNLVKTELQRGRCDMFRRLVGKLGAVVPSDAEACRHFERGEA